MKAGKKFWLFFLTYISVLRPVFSLSPENAVLLEKSGNTGEALKLYDEWLKSEKFRPDYSETLLHAAGLTSDADDFLAMVGKYSEFCENTGKSSVYAAAADISNMTGRPELAAEYYHKAAETAFNNQNRINFLIESAALELYTGNYVKSAQTALKILEKTENTVFRDNAEVLLALSGLMEEGGLKAYEQLEDYVNSRNNNKEAIDPVVYYTLYRIAEKNGNTGLKDKIYRIISGKYKTTLAEYSVNNKIKNWYYPGDFIDWEFKDNVNVPETPENNLNSRTLKVQAGAFQNRNNAAAMLDKLKKDGFQAVIINENSLWKVLIYSDDPEIITRLKKRGYSTVILQ